MNEPAEIRSVSLPAGSLVATLPFDDYRDAFRARVDPERFPDIDAFARAFARRPPAWIAGAMGLRDSIVGLFGLKTSGGMRSTGVDAIGAPPRFEVGSRVGIFRIVERTDHEILAGEDDRHLDFRLSLLYERAGDDAFVTVSTVVRFNNALGRVYFVPVRPVHTLVVPSMIRSALGAA